MEMDEWYRTNPESEAIRQDLAKQRAASRRSGKTAMWVLGSLSVLLTVAASVLVIAFRSPVIVFLLIEVEMLGGFGFMFYLMGYTELQRGQRPITDREVEARRRSERAKLYRQSLGQLP